jgi:uncharacterized protein (TIGR02145 family)
MCHNLGGLDIISPSQLITYEHHGNWYRFGAKNYSLKNEGTNNGIVDNWTIISHPDYPFYTENLDWPATPADQNDPFGDPCPAGWRLPAITELAAVVNKDANDNNITEINPLTDVPATWLPESDQTFSNLKKSGDYLYLPTPGLRYYDDGSLRVRGYRSYYWSSTGFDSAYSWCMSFYSESGAPSVYGTNRRYGFSVRCVQAE